MERGPASGVLREIRALYTTGTSTGLTDAELLERFVARDGEEAEDAFAALVHRHGPTVLGACRRMLPRSHDAEDAFQATFLVLARRAASILRREQLASWLYGVAVRIARDARRRAARHSAGERRLMDVSRVEPKSADDPDDVLPMLDEELNRLPHHYRAALVACELEGKSRREAALQLGIPEGTLSTHLARGRKLLRERLLRRGVKLGLGPIAGIAHPLAVPAVPERLMGPLVRAALGYARGAGAVGTIPSSVSSLVERMLKMMLLTRLTLVIAALMTAAGAVAAVALGLTTTAAQSQRVDSTKAGADDLPGRVMDKSGAGAPNVEIWAMDGILNPETVARTTTDGEGQFVMPQVVHRLGSPGRFSNLSVFARGRDGTIGWQSPVSRNSPDEKTVEIELHAVGDVQGRLTDQDARPIASVEVAPVVFRPPANAFGTSFIRLSAEVSALFRTRTASDGSFVLKGIPRGAGIFAVIAAPAFGSPTISWDTTQPVTIVLDSRLGQIKGRLKAFVPRACAPIFARLDKIVRFQHAGNAIEPGAAPRQAGSPPTRGGL